MRAMSLATEFAGRSPSFQNALHADQPATDRVEKMALYGRFIGRWQFDGECRGNNGRGEIHFGWILGGHAIQDVWILPGMFHGTTLRVYDPNIDAWHILWSDPFRQYYSRQIGRARGEDIVQDGSNDAGETTRWTFSNIKRDSFSSRGEISHDGGRTWQVEADFRARRIREEK